MIYLPNKERDQPPMRLLRNGALRQIKRAIDNVDGEQYNQSYYPHEDVVNLLRAYSIHKTRVAAEDMAKCNYCESKVENGVTLQVEHYRPKAKIESGENDHIDLPGYYWLGLEWTNLLLACPKCNGKDAKGNKFPIRGIRAQPIAIVSLVQGQLTLDRSQCDAQTAPLSDEQPLLLNPEIDHPDHYLTFDHFGNMLAHGNDVERGQTSIETYRLNRDSLLLKRIKVWNDFHNRILLAIAGHQSGRLNDDGLRFCFEGICREIIERRSPEEEFTLWGRYINDHIAQLLAGLGDNYVQIFCDEYQRFLQRP